MVLGLGCSLDVDGFSGGEAEDLVRGKRREGEGCKENGEEGKQKEVRDLEKASGGRR